MHTPLPTTRSAFASAIARRLSAFLALLLFVICLAPNLQAQIDTGGLAGTVFDSTGAAIPRVTINLKNEATGVVASVPSGNTGSYTFEALKPGSYTLQVASPGFKAFSSSGVQIHVQQIATIDIHLETGAVSEQVTVTSAAPLLQAEDASVGQTIEAKTVDSMPLNGRNWASLSQLAAGVTTTTTALGGNTSSAFFSVNGVNYWQNDFRLDGIDDNIEMYGGSQVGSNASITPPPDAIEEFKLQNGDFSAEFGHSTGGVVNAVVKSGGNQVHGDVWEYLRNDAIDANDYFSKQNGIPIPEYRQNQFGGTVGGPILIPHLYNGRDKTFFFFDYQGTRIIQPSAATSTVPTAGMQSSDFQNLQDLITFNSGTRTDALGRIAPIGTVFDPATTRSVAAGAVDPITGLTNTSSSAVSVRDPFYTGGSVAGITDFTTRTGQLNQLPATRLDPNAIKLLQLYPTATGAGFANNYFQNGKSNQTTNQIDFRVDQNFSSRDIVFGVFDWSHYLLFEPPSLPGIADGQNFGTGDNDSPHYAVAIGYTHLFSTTLTNEFRFGFDHNIDNVIAPEGGQLGIPAQYGIQGVPQVAGNGGLPAISISGLSGLGVSPYVPTIRTIKSLEFSDNATKTLSSHTLKAGYQIDSIEGDIIQPPYGRGGFSYNGQYTSIPNVNSGVNGIADALLTPIASTVGGVNNVGGVASFQGSNYSTVDDHRYYMGAYFQDDWKVSPKLTLNLGIRWDLTTPYAETSGRQANFIAAGGNGATGTFYLPQKTCNAPRSTSFNTLLGTDNIALQCVSGLSVGNASYSNFAPRLGFAYRISPQLVVRGGYGIAYGALDNIGFGGTLGTNYPFQYSLSFNSPNSTSPLVLSTGQTATVENALGVVNLQDPTQVTGSGISLVGRQYNFQTPYTQTQNLTVQYQFSRHDSVQAAYVGTLGRHLDVQGSHNSPSQIVPNGASIYNYIPFPDFSPNSSYLSTNGASDYNSLQTVYARQVANGLSVLFNYTYSKCFTDQAAQSGSFPGYRAEWLPGFGIEGDNQLCDTDSTHVIHASGTYQLPVGRGQMFLSKSNKVVDAVLGGWSANYIYTHQSGQPFTVGCPVATSAFFGCHANVVPGANINAGPHDQKQWLNPNAFSQPPVAAPGQLSFAVLGGEGQQARGPELNNLDASLFKEFSLREQTRLQFRAESFNLANTPQFNNPGTLDFTNTTKFSQITSLRGNARLLQFALKLYY